MNQNDDLTDYSSLALAGLVLAAELVHDRAHGRHLNPAASAAVKCAITTQHAASLREVFPQTTDLRAGVRSAMDALRGKPKNAEVLRYALQLIELASLLHSKSQRSRAVVARLGQELDRLPVEPTDRELAQVYQASISTLGKRIEVSGNPELLREQSTADEIRALLLGGIRFAWLWQQLGGRRWHLIVQRKSVLRSLQALDTILQSSIH